MSLPIAILAGGLATRLQPVTAAVPKSLLEVAGRPFIFHQLELLRRNRIVEVVLCVGHLGEQIQAVLGDGGKLGMHVRYVSDGPQLLGTGGALKNALPELGPAFLVLYGDSYLDIDYQEVVGAFETSGKLGLMTVFRNQGRWDRSNIHMQGNRILAYDKHFPTANMQYIDYGLGALKRAALDDVSLGQPSDLADIYRALLAREELAAAEVKRRFYEIGSIAGLEETSEYLKGKK
jgi:MurNAc alpha-1-phosphate uridylyltransferase